MRPRTAVLLLAPLLVACDGTTRPEPMAGTYELASVSGESPPRVVHAEPVGTARGPARMLSSIDGGSIAVDPQGRLSLKLAATARLVSAVDGSVLDARTGHGAVVGFLVGDAVAFASDTIRLPIGPLGLGEATVGRSAITLHVGRTGLGAELRFER